MLNISTCVKMPYMKPFNCVKIKLLVLDNNTWKHLTVCKHMGSDLFKDITYKLFVCKSYIFNTYIYIGFGIK